MLRMILLETKKTSTNDPIPWQSLATLPALEKNNIFSLKISIVYLLAPPFFIHYVQFYSIE